MALVRYNPNLQGTIIKDVARSLWEHRSYIGEWASKMSSIIGGLFGSQSKKSKPGKKGKRMPRGLMQEGKGDRSMFSATPPVAYGSVIRNPNYLGFSSIPKPVGEMVGALRVIGRQALVGLTFTNGSATTLLSDINGATIANNLMQLSPDTFNGRLALIGRVFTKFAFRYIRFLYIPNVATSQGGSFVLALIEDPDVDNTASLTYINLSNCVPSVQTTVYIPTDLEYHYEGQELFWTENNTATVAGERQTSQGSFTGMPTAAPGATTFMGYVIAEFVCDLYQPSVDFGFSVSVTKEEKDMLMRMRATEREDCEVKSVDLKKKK